MRILSLDYDPTYGEDAVRTSFNSDESVFDFDVVIWDPLYSIRNYHSYSTYRSLPSLTEDSSVRLLSDIKRRKAEFADFIDSGRDFIVIARSPQRAYFDTGKREYSGTGRNRTATRIVEEVTIQSALPIPSLSFTQAGGTRADLVGDGPLQRLLRKYKEHIRYSATVGGDIGVEIARVSGTTKTLACLVSRPSGGHVLVLPSMSFAAVDGTDPGADEDEDEDGDEGWTDDAPEFFETLLDALRDMSGERSVSRPSWSRSFATGRQRTLRAEATSALTAVEEARAALTTAQQAVDRAEIADQLYLGTGRTLELQVKEVLELLGGVVTEPEAGRDDWRVEFPEGAAVVEVKGVSKSAAEKHAAQLEKWIANHYEETGVQPKGLLIVNTWRDTPLDERTESDFPDQMLKYSTSREHCLITGLQLFLIREELALGLSTAEGWRRRILTTNGVLEGASDWSALIEREGTETSNPDPK